MPHRVHASDRNSGFVSSAASSYYHSEQVASHHEDPATYQRIHTQPTPPPIATLHHSPAMSTSSLASSSISPSPPITQPSTPYYQQGAPMQAAPAYPYNPNSALGARYDAAPPYATASHPVQVSTRSIRPSYVNSQPYPGQPNYIVHTDDAATKLSDRVRRKCYNCRTTDTSTWRRSSLTPGKVLCNKCGLFERTHSRPRPEQFPHKRGPLVTATFKSSRSPPPTSSRLPPIATHHMHAMPPHHSNHPSIAPLMSRAEQGPTMQQQQIQGQQNYHNHNASTLPEIRSLLNTPASAGSPASTSSAHESVEQQHEQRAPSPQQGASLDGSPRSDRHDVHAYRAGN
ncbi:hypothetical protein WOLCODRAFT_133057 [Wolfiporia cocos MD-104 SS10]|uniref:GATA-type domain-containing protein n=1 Tax=Wolfiporia cocos (strain MD-104) TaxID=742152 RepID=A0A2H3K6F2_WOLCO|nr:hypothetical protein WOLCODRAFT_133057 [Wolfiporia cocos MD-104 SS10]